MDYNVDFWPANLCIWYPRRAQCRVVIFMDIVIFCTGVILAQQVTTVMWQWYDLIDINVDIVLIWRWPLTKLKWSRGLWCGIIGDASSHLERLSARRMRRLTSATPAAGASMMRELSRSSDSSRTNSREMLEVVLHKKDDDERLTPHHHHHHQHHMQQLHQLRSTDSGPRLSPMLLRTPHLQQNNNLGDFSRGPSSFSRKSLSRQSLDSNSHISDVCDDRENHQHHHQPHEDGAGCACASGTGIFLHSLGLLAVASLVLSAMSLLLLSAVSQAVDTGHSNHHHSLGATRSPSPNDDSAKREPPESYKIATSSSGSDAKISSTSSKSQAVGKGWGAAEGFTLTGQTLATTADQSPDLETRKALGRFAGTQSLIEAAVAMTTLVVVANLCCLMVCCMQCFFAAKLLKTYEGEAR